MRTYFWTLFLVSAGCSQTGREAEGSSKGLETTKPIWIYSDSVDKMREDRYFYADLRSNNYPELNDPYGGGSPLTLHISKLQGDTFPDNYAPRLIISNGQFDCSSEGRARSCMITAKADNRDPIELHAVETDCGSAKCLVLNNDPYGPLSGKSLIPILRSAQRFVIEAPLYRFGNYQYEFNTAGLDWSEGTNRR